MEARKRKARFSVQEIDVLVDEAYKNRSTLFSRFSTTITNEKKMLLWQTITEKINEVCTVHPRTTDEVRRKWYYYLSDKKKEVNQRNQSKKTGRHTLDIPDKPKYLKILELLGELDAADPYVNDEVEGLVCEVDAEALSVRSPSASSEGVDHSNEHGYHYQAPTLSRESLSSSSCSQDNCDISKGMPT